MMHDDKAWKDSHRTLKVLPCGRSQECIEKSAARVIGSGSKCHPRPWCVGWPAGILTRRLCGKPCRSRPPHPLQVGVLCVSPVLQPCACPYWCCCKKPYSCFSPGQMRFVVLQGYKHLPHLCFHSPAKSLPLVHSGKVGVFCTILLLVTISCVSLACISFV